MKKYLKHALIIAASLFGLSIFSVLFYRFVPVYFTPLMIFKAVGDGYGINHTWVPLEKISKNISEFRKKSAVSAAKLLAFLTEISYNESNGQRRSELSDRGAIGPIF